MTEVNVEKIGGVGLITFSSKDKLNKINADTLESLSKEMAKLDIDDEVKAIVTRTTVCVRLCANIMCV